MQPKILIVEDDVMASAFLTHILKDDFDIMVHETSMAALEWLRNEEEPPSLVIADLQMPDMSGYEFITKIKTIKRTCKIPLIIVSAEDKEWVKEKCLKAGANAYFVKPVVPLELKNTALQLLTAGNPAS